jgi:hypothetical protein
MKKLVAAVGLLLVIATGGRAQAEHHYRGEGYLYFAPATSGTSVVGAGGEGFIYKGFALGLDTGSTLNKDAGVWITSADAYYHFHCCRARSRVEPFIAGGYTVLAIAGTNSALNFGGGVAIWAAKRVGVRFEVRDHTPNNGELPGRQNNFVEFRIGFTFR